MIDGSPLDEGECGNKLISELLATDKSLNPVGYITSDSPSAASQIFNSMNWNRTLVTPKGCHVEMDRSGRCSFETIAYWFALALSDSIIVQGRVLEKGGNMTSPSGFSRYAAIYGLNSGNLRFGPGCLKVTEAAIQSRTSQGTWKCTEKRHFEEGALIRASDQKEIFVIRNGTRRSIPNWDTFLHEGFRLQDVQPMDPVEWINIPLGPSLEPCSSC